MQDKLFMKAPSGAKLYVEDVFSTWIYDGNGSTQTIPNGIDLAGGGGMVWIKVRSLADQSAVFDSARGVSKSIATNLTSAQYDWTGSGVDQLNSDGFRVDGNNSQFNDSLYNYASWTFRKSAKFFDVVTYTGDGASSRAITHSLGSTPGCVIVKRTDSTGRWKVWHRSVPSQNGNLNDTSAFDANHNNMFFQGYISATSSTTFTVAQASTGLDDVNANGATYVAYLFAHDAGGFGDAGDQSVISCGSYTGDGTTDGSKQITTNWEPQWVLIKCASSGTTNWLVFDNIRGVPLGTNDFAIYPNDSSGEQTLGYIHFNQTGFALTNSATAINSSGQEYVYVAIRRGPMKTPTDATKVFQPVVYTGNNVDNRLINTTITPDFVMIRQRNDTVVPGMYTATRLTGQEFMITGSTAAGATDADSFDSQLVSAASAEYGNTFSSMSGIWVGNDITRKFNANTTANNHVIHAFKRAPGFMDIVCYAGDGVANRTVQHNLGVAPKLIIIKRRNVGSSWLTYTTVIDGSNDYVYLSSNVAKQDATASLPTSSLFYVSSGTEVNASGSNYIAVMFGDCPGVSKVGSYTGNGTSQTIDCGFTAGARYVLIKRTDTFSEWFVFDTARGITAGSDPYLLPSSTANETTNVDTIDPANSGFVIVQDGNTELNVNSGTYIYLAIA